MRRFEIAPGSLLLFDPQFCSRLPWKLFGHEMIGLPIGAASLTIGNIFYITLAIALLLYLTGRIKYWLVRNTFARSGMDIDVLTAIGSMMRYIVVALALIINLQTAGIDLSGLTVLAGALGIGIGFGLQNNTTNFVSGLIILPVNYGFSG